MYWLLKGNEDKESCVFYQIFNKSNVIEFNNFYCYDATKSTDMNKSDNEEIVLTYDIYIKDNLIKYVNKKEEKTFIYETSKIDNNFLTFKNSYNKTENYKLPLLIDSCYDNIYKNIQFKICQLSNNTLQIQNNNKQFILSMEHIFL
jgi:hypothetical protein